MLLLVNSFNVESLNVSIVIINTTHPLAVEIGPIYLSSFWNHFFGTLLVFKIEIGMKIKYSQNTLNVDNF